MPFRSTCPKLSIILLTSALFFFFFDVFEFNGPDSDDGGSVKTARTSFKGCKKSLWDLISRRAMEPFAGYFILDCVLSPKTLKTPVNWAWILSAVTFSFLSCFYLTVAINLGNVILLNNITKFFSALHNFYFF